VPSPPGARRLAATACALVPVAASVHALGYSWERWGEAAIDWGRELEVARELADGRVLYADVHYWYGPLVPYLNAGLFACFGAHTRVLQAAGLAAAALMTALVFALARRLGGGLAGAAVASAFVYCCAFGHYYVADIFNWATPYTYVATDGMLLATASLYALLRHLDDERSAWLGLSLACLAATLLTKLEAMLPVLVAHAAFLATRRGLDARRWARLAAAYGAALLVPAVIVGVFTLRAGTASYQTSALSQVKARNAGPILQYMGIADWRDATAALAVSALWIVACVALPALLARALPTTADTGAVALAAAACAALPVLLLRDADPLRVLRALPVVAVAGLADAALRSRRPADVVLWAFAAGALARLPLAAGAHHYGFYLVPIPLAALLLVWFRWLPDRFGGAPRARVLAGAAGVAVAATLCWTHARASAAMWARHTAHVVAPRGDLWLLDDVGGVRMGSIYAAAIARLQAYPPATTVMGAPEGAGLAFLAGLSTWHGRFSYYPPETGPEADRDILRDLEADPPGVVLLLNLLDLRAYGVTRFGIDYATESVGWILRRYEVDRAFVDNAVVILRPRGVPPPP
jgi:hypothetical protein